jgi:hypothetical protein
MNTTAASESPVQRPALTLSFALLGLVVLVSVLFAIESLYGGWYALFKTVHITFAVVWVGGGFLLTLGGIIAEQKNDPQEIAIVARHSSSSRTW